MTFESRQIDKAVVLSPRGRIDHANVAVFQTALESFLGHASPDVRVIVLDMAGVEYINSAGLRVLLMASKKGTTGQGRMVLAALSPAVREVFAISRLSAFFPLFDGVEAALATSGSLA